MVKDIVVTFETMSSCMLHLAHQHMRYGTVKPELLTEFDLKGGAGRARLLAGPYADQVGPTLVVIASAIDNYQFGDSELDGPFMVILGMACGVSLLDLLGLSVV